MILRRLYLSTGGESHGRALVGILSGLPAGLPMDPACIQKTLQQRRTAGGRGGRSRLIEEDEFRFVGGVYQGQTSGAPLVLEIPNRAARDWEGEPQPTVARPGHADYPGMLKFGWPSWMPIAERASGRQTVLWTAFGALARQALQHLGIEVLGFVQSLGTLKFRDAPARNPDLNRLRQQCETSVFRTLEEKEAHIHEELERLRRAGTTLGGTVRVLATGLPPGLGSGMEPHLRLDVRLGGSLLSIPSVVSVGFGDPSLLASQTGQQVLDGFDTQHPGKRRSNHQGGVEGGMSNGMPLRILLHCKPIPTQRQALPGFDPTKGETRPAPYRRSDWTAVPAVSVVAETVTALVLLDVILEHTGGDRWEEVISRFKAYREHLLSFRSSPGETGRST